MEKHRKVFSWLTHVCIHFGWIDLYVREQFCEFINELMWLVILFVYVFLIRNFSGLMIVLR